MLQRSTTGGTGGLDRSAGGRGPALQLSTVAEVGSKIASATTLREILRAVATGARWLVNYEYCSLALVASQSSTVRLYVFSPVERLDGDATTYPLHNSLVEWIFGQPQPIRIGDLEQHPQFAGQQDPALRAGSRSALILPLISDNVVMGTLNFSTRRPDAYPRETLAMGRLLALQVGSAVRNALLLEELDGAENVIVSLALAIEAKDPYTEGHCQRLAVYASRLGQALGAGTERLHKLRMAGLLHDVGKIAIPEAILSKPGPLTAEEFDVLKQHPVSGERICQPLRSARALLPAIRHHHERWDGQGYPDGLAGAAIPADARIIAIVDAFDAMTSDRPYRLGLPVKRALDILRTNAGPQWDPELVTVFIALIEADLVVDQPIQQASL